MPSHLPPLPSPAQVEAEKHKRDQSDAWSAEVEQAFKQKIVDRCAAAGLLAAGSAVWRPAA